MAEFIHTDGTIKTYSEIKRDNPHTSFPSVFTTELANSLGYSGILGSAQPEPSSNLKVIVRDGAEKNSKGQWVEKWKEIDRHSDIEGGKTKAEQDKEYQTKLDDEQKNNLRANREPLLEEADWEINKLEDSGGDASAWRTYRQKLRDITKASDIYNVTWPTKP